MPVLALLLDGMGSGVLEVEVARVAGADEASGAGEVEVSLGGMVVIMGYVV